MNTYRTSEIAEIIGVHPNTVRLYEELGLIPKPGRLPNGYRVFTELHIEQFRLARLAFQIEVLQNGLRKKIVQMVKVSAAGDYEKALELTREYLLQIRQEIANAEEATQIAEQMEQREGGYTRIVKIAPRVGDNAPAAIIELVTEPVAKKAVVKEAEAATKVAEEEAPAVETEAAEAAEAPVEETAAAEAEAPAEEAEKARVS